MMAVVGALAMLVGWWSGTALVLFVSRSVGVRRRSWLVASTLGVFAALAAVGPVASGDGPHGALAGALLGFAIWFWVETTFYTGWITGLRVRVETEAISWRRRLWRAVCACLWHEMLSLTLLIALAWSVWSAPNRWSLVIYGTFWCLHQISRLNVLAGVPKHFAGWLPEHLTHLHALFRPGPSRGRVELTVALLAGLAALSTVMVWAADEASRPGWAALAMLLAIGAAEHVVLLGWVDLDRLWRVGRAAPWQTPAVPWVPGEPQSSTNSGAGARRL